MTDQEYEYGLDDLTFRGAVVPVPWDGERAKRYAANFDPPRRVYRRPIPEWEEVE